MGEARTVADLERKYKFSQLLSLTKNVKMNKDFITKVENELLNYTEATTRQIEDLQNQVDGNITTWFYSGIPTLSNLPVSDWTEAEYSTHLGDLYYDLSTGYSYRFALQGTTYLWIKLTDSDVTQALSLASVAKDTADGKRRVFTEQPTPPYDIGDLYLKNQELYVCSTARASGSYVSTDFIVATKYTDDSSLQTFVNTTYATAMSNLTTQIDGKTETWFYAGVPTLNNLPASNWTTEQQKLSHLDDLYYDKTTGYSYIFEYDTVYKWTRIKDSDISEVLSIANAAQDTADGKRQVFLATPTTPYQSGDLWINNQELYVCQVGRSSGNFVSSDFTIATKYTDDTVAEAIVDELGGTTTTILSGQVITYMANYAKFTDLATGGSTIINGANISTGTINTDNVSIGNNNVIINSRGIELANGAKIVGSDGLKTTLLFTSEDKYKQCGYSPDDPFVITSVKKKGVSLKAYVPANFVVTSAKVKFYHTPTYWSYLNQQTYKYDHIWGYCRNIVLYKANNTGTRFIEAVYEGEYKEDNNTTYYEIGNSFGTNGWTADVPSNNSHNTQEVTSIDIKNHIGSGFNEFYICPKPDGSASWGESGICNRTSFIYATIAIEGYIKYV